jgi:AraC-like DNA-binding protein
MPPTLNGLQGAELFRPEEFAGELELTSSAPARRTFSTRVCEGFEITLLMSGRSAGLLGGQPASFPVGAPFVWSQAVWSAPLSTCACISLEIGPLLYMRLASEWPVPPRLQHGTFTILPTVLEAFWRAHRALRSAESAAARSHTLIALLSKIFGQVTAREPSVWLASSALDRVRAAIHDDPAAERSIHALAALAGLSSFELVAAFRRRYGLSPAGYREAVRISAARRMLGAGRSVEETAEQLGYRSLAVFCSRFARSVGLAPERYAIVA